MQIIRNIFIAITTAIITVVFSLAFLTLPLFGSHKILVVLSDSMKPLFGAGSLILIRPSITYSIGDVISFQLPQAKQFVTHRIVSISNQNVYQTKGDANRENDGFTVLREQIIGKHVGSLPYAGRIVSFAKSKQGIAILILIPALVTLFSELAYLLSKLRFPLRSEAFFLAGLLFGSATMVGTTRAFFSDTAASTSNIFQSSQFFPADHLVISEIQIHGANANQDFVELYNPTNGVVDLNGWKIRKKTSNGTETSLVLIGSGKMIPARGFFLWANNQGDYHITVNADVNNGNNLSENNSVALKKPDDSIVDQVAWGNGTGQFLEGNIFPNNPATSQSIERFAYSTSNASSMGIGGSDEFNGNSFDSNDNSTDFYVRGNSQPQNSGSATETP